MKRGSRGRGRGSIHLNYDSNDTPGRVMKGPHRGRRSGGGRPKKSIDIEQTPSAASTIGSPSDSRESSPFTPNNPPPVARRTTRAEARLLRAIEEFCPDEERRAAGLAAYFANHPDCKEQYAKLVAERVCFPPSIREKEQIRHNGVLYSVGDIVKLRDEDDDKWYFAQIRSMIRDQFSRPYAAITWLAPRTTAVSPWMFQPEHFSHALIDHTNYVLEALRWECARPDVEMYKVRDHMRDFADKRRLELMRDRRKELWEIARQETMRGHDYVRAGDVRSAHNEEIVEEILKTAQARDIDRERAEKEKLQREEAARRKKEEEEEEKRKEEIKEEEDDDGEGGDCDNEEKRMKRMELVEDMVIGENNDDKEEMKEETPGEEQPKPEPEPEREPEAPTAMEVDYTQ